MAGHLGVKATDPDGQFFVDHPDRFSHIRKPRTIFVRDQSRSVRAMDECTPEFASLGEHKRDRRRIILWRVPPGHPMFNPMDQQILKIPFLAFADETIEDTDSVLLPIIEQLMWQHAIFYASARGNQ